MSKEELDIQKEIENYFTESTGFGRDKIKNFMDIVNKALRQKGERIEVLETRCTELFLQNNESVERFEKAKEIIKELLLLPYANNEEVYADITSTLDKAEQFLKENE